jgi:methyl-accepting chemotaxis protein
LCDSDQLNKINLPCPVPLLLLPFIKKNDHYEKIVSGISINKTAHGFSILIAMMLILGAVAIYQLNASNHHIDKFRENRMPGVRYTLEMRGVLSEMRLQQTQYIASVTPGAGKHRVELLQNQAIFLNAQQQYAKMSKDA